VSVVRKSLLAAMSALSISGCATNSMPPVEAVEYVDLERFMGAWYVIASIPTFIETEAYNAVESYRLGEDGTIETTFTFRKGGFDGELKEYNPTGFVKDEESNAVWGMQFIWPIKADYRIAYLDDGYTLTVIARNQRDYVWIMARTPEISDEAYAELVALIEEIGYDTSALRKVPQRWQES
jgi:apolipoprotein D and lipocalin family protein